VNSKLFRPISACAQHARIRFVFGCLFWPLGMAIMLSLAFPIISQGASLAMLSGTVYVDLNTDGAYQPGDLGVRGDLILLFRQNDLTTPIRTTTTNSKGQYTFTDLDPGIYTVRDSTPSMAGNTANLGTIFDSVNNVLPTTGLGDFNSSMAQVSNITLNAGYQGYAYNFGDDQYPMQLYSKYLLTFDTNNNIHHAIVTPVPEPASIVGLLTAAGMVCGWALLRCRRTKS
jgi:hypothetical protein